MQIVEQKVFSLIPTSLNRHDAETDCPRVVYNGISDKTSKSSAYSADMKYLVGALRSWLTQLLACL